MDLHLAAFTPSVPLREFHFHACCIHLLQHHPVPPLLVHT